MSNLGLVAPDPLAQQLLLIVAGGGNALVVQLLGNGLDAVARYVETEDLPYDFGVLLDDDDLVRVLILEVFLKCYIGIINIDMMPIDTRHFDKKRTAEAVLFPGCLPPRPRMGDFADGVQSLPIAQGQRYE